MKKIYYEAPRFIRMIVFSKGHLFRCNQIDYGEFQCGKCNKGIIVNPKLKEKCRECKAWVYEIIKEAVYVQKASLTPRKGG